MVHSRRFPVPLLPILLLWPNPVEAQSEPALRWFGEVRPRAEAREPTDAGWDHLTSMRTRIGLDATMEGSLRLYLQFQDVRIWGEETGVRDKAADALDFHQAFLEVQKLPGVGGLIRAGRQEVGLGEQRLLGAPDWGQAGQTFDGARYTATRDGRQFDLVFLKLQEGSAPAHESDAEIVAAWFSTPIQSSASADFFLVHDRASGPERTAQSTFGGTWRAEPGPWSLRLQGMVQLGERGGEDVSAFMVAARAGVAIWEDRASATLWYDYLSGDEDPADAEAGSFSTLFGARNRYYGRADYFTDIPVQTGGLGLQDAVLKLSVAPTEALRLNLDVHSFRSATLGETAYRRLGEEADVWARYQPRKHLTLQAGYSLVWAGPLLEELGRLSGIGNFAYFMTSVTF